MLFALVAIGLALILAGASAPGLAPYQAKRWLSAEEHAAVQTRLSVERVLRHLDQTIQLGLLILGGLIVVFSAVGIWSCQRATQPPAMAKGDELKPERGSRCRMLHVLAFGLMFLGLLLSVMGQTAETDSFRDGPTTFPDGPSFIGRDWEREQAYALKNAGVVLVLAGPIIWVLGGWLLSRHKRAELGVAPDRNGK